MKQVTISAKNQITLPVAILRKQNLTPGKKLYVIDSGSSITLTSKTPFEYLLEEGERIRQLPISKPLIDPLKERQKMRDEWDRSYV